MEDILDTYATPYNKSFPVVCMDEQPFQLVKEISSPIEATLSHPKRVDYEYERAGTSSIFMFAEPLIGWRKATVRPHRTKKDWAIEVEELLRTKYSDAEKLILVCDNLNVHTRGAFYEAFSPDVARKIVKHIEFRYTPTHGSWLNIAENELSAMTRQCISHRRIGNIEVLRQEIAAWASGTNSKQRLVNWQFNTDQARTKLKSLYPRINT